MLGELSLFRMRLSKMWGVTFAWLIAALLFCLASEAVTPYLVVLGSITAVWFVIAGAVAGYRWGQAKFQDDDIQL